MQRVTAGIASQNLGTRIKMEIRIEPTVLAQEQNDGNGSLVIDVRSPEEYAAGHVADAINLPLAELEARLAEVPTDTPVVTYCMMKHRGHSRGERAADLLRARGYQASVLEGGLPAWEGAGLPTERGTASTPAA
jgi:phage shock protein E